PLGGRVIPLALRHLAVSLPVPAGSTEPSCAEHRLLQVQADLAFVGVADSSMQLDATFRDLERCRRGARLRLAGGGGARWPVDTVVTGSACRLHHDGPRQFHLYE